MSSLQMGHDRMSVRPSSPLRFEVLVRVFADAVMVNAALLLALMLHYLWVVSRSASHLSASHLSALDLVWNYVDSYLMSCGVLTILSLTIFALHGFYSYGRYYQHRFKVLAITQATSLAYLSFSFLVLLSWSFLSIPRSVLLPAWFITLGFLLGSRASLEFLRRVVGKSSDLEPVRPESLEKTRRVLVIGGAGYIGSALLPKLLEKGYQVRLVDLLVYGTEPIRDLLSHPNLEIVRADFRQVDAMVKAMQDVESVIHLGGIVGDPACQLDEDVTIEVNLMASRMLGEVAKGMGVKRMIFASTCSVYGASDDLLNERSMLSPVSLYASSKLASERVLLQLANDEFAPVIVRFATVYGLSGRIRFDLVVNLLTAKAVMDGEITVFNGDQWRPFVHVDDAARSLLTVLETPLSLVRNQIFNVGSNEQNYTLREVAEIIQRHVPDAKVLETQEGGDRRNYRVSFEKIRRILGFVPRWTLEEGIEQTIDAIASGQIVDYQEPRYSNERVLVAGNEDTSELLRCQNGWALDLLRDAWPSFAGEDDGGGAASGLLEDRLLRSLDEAVGDRLAQVGEDVADTDATSVRRLQR
jgi:nucleoside-diphosphate-sugar epimerase